MHINPRHRHIVVLPLFIALLALSTGLPSSLPGERTQASIVRASKDILFRDGSIAGRLLVGGEMNNAGDDRELRSGSMVLRSDGEVRLHAADALLLAFHGAFHVTLSENSLNVIALTSPVLVQKGDATIVIPPGAQGTWDLGTLDMAQALQSTLTFLPEDILRTELQSLLELPQADSAIAPSSFDLFSVLPRLPSAEHRALAAIAAVDLQSLSAGTTDDAVAAQQLLRSFAALTPSERLPVPGVDLALSRSLSRPSVLAQLLPLLPQQDLRLLTFYHSQTRTAAWTQQSDQLSPAFHWMKLVFFPSTDVSPDAASDLTFRQWQEETEAALASADDPSAMMEALLQRSEPLRIFTTQYGYPERYARYGTVFQSLAAPYEAQFSEAARRLLDQWSHPEYFIHPDATMSSSSVRSAPAVEPLTVKESDALEGQAYTLLQQQGALFTAQTTLKAASLDHGRVHVAGMLFSDGSAVHTYDFDLVLPTNSIDHIVRDGQGSAYALSLEKFVRWVKGE